MSTEGKKRAAALAAVDHVGRGSIVGVGTGSTADQFVEALAGVRDRIEATVASSLATAEKLLRLGIRVIDLNDVDALPLYVDGADEATRRRELIKGAGGALTREKVVAAASRIFICIVDDSKLVPRLGGSPLAVEILPMARRYVAGELIKLGGRPALREGFITDNGNVIVDVHGLVLDDPSAIEAALDQIAGVVGNGLFCRRPADLLLVGGETGVEAID